MNDINEVTNLLTSRQSITTDDFSHFLTFLDFRERFQHVIQRTDVQVQKFVQMLMVACDPKMRVLSYHARCWIQFATQKLQKCRLSRTIWTNESKTRVQVDFCTLRLYLRVFWNIS